MPTVVMKLDTKSSPVNLIIRHVLPTALSPMVKIFSGNAAATSPVALYCAMTSVELYKGVYALLLLLLFLLSFFLFLFSVYSLLLFSSPPPLSVVISSVSQLVIQSVRPSVYRSVRPSVCVCEVCVCKKERKEGREGREGREEGNEDACCDKNGV